MQRLPRKMTMAAANTSHEEIARIVNGEVFFLVGAARSGTTWLQLCLDGHPDVSCSGEGHFTDVLAPRLTRAVNGYNKEIRDRDVLSLQRPDAFLTFGRSEARALLASAIALLLKKNAGGKACRWLGEKTPDNVLHMQLLADLFPRCRFIHIIRDGRDAAVSAWFNNLRISEAQTMAKFGNFQGYMQRYAASWSAKIRTARAYGKKYPDRYCELSYEDLHRNFVETFRGVLAFLEVEAGDAAIETCRAAGRFSKQTGGRSRGAEDSQSHFRKGAIGDWKAHFDEDSMAAFGKEAGALLEELGYAG